MVNWRSLERSVTELRRVRTGSEGLWIAPVSSGERWGALESSGELQRAPESLWRTQGESLWRAPERPRRAPESFR
eukprot:14376383-Alexandrium_andersonii.AAC.1